MSKQRVTVGDLLDIRDMTSIVPPGQRRRLLARISESDRQLVDESRWDSDRHAVDDVRLLSDDELVDDRDIAQLGDAETLDLSGPGVEESDDLIEVPVLDARCVELWDAINAFAESSPMSDGRMDAVVRINRALAACGLHFR